MFLSTRCPLKQSSSKDAILLKKRIIFLTEDFASDFGEVCKDVTRRSSILYGVKMVVQFLILNLIQPTLPPWMRVPNIPTGSSRLILLEPTKF